MPNKEKGATRKRRHGGSAPVKKKSRSMYAGLPLTRTALGKVLHAINDEELPPPPRIHPDHWCGWCSEEFNGSRPKLSRQIHFFRHQGPWRCDIPGCSLREDHDFLNPYNLAKHKKRPHGSSKHKNVLQLQQDAAGGALGVCNDSEDDIVNCDMSPRTEVSCCGTEQLELSQCTEAENMEPNENPELHLPTETQDFPFCDISELSQALVSDCSFSNGFDALSAPGADDIMDSLKITEDYVPEIISRYFTPFQPVRIGTPMPNYKARVMEQRSKVRLYRTTNDDRVKPSPVFYARNIFVFFCFVAVMIAVVTKV